MCECAFFIVCVGVWNGTPEPGTVCVCGRSTFQNFRLRFFNQWVSCDISGLAVPVPVPKAGDLTSVAGCVILDGLVKATGRSHIKESHYVYYIQRRLDRSTG